MSKNNNISVNFDYEKIPPQCVDIEIMILGSILLENEAQKVIDRIKVEYFYRPIHQIIFKNILELSDKNDAIDILTLSNQLKSNSELDDVGGYYYISQLTTNIGSSINIDTHIKILIQKFIQREFIRIGNELQKMSYGDDCDILDIFEFSEKEIFNLSQRNFHSNIISLTDSVKESIKQIEKIKSNKGKLIGVPSGVTSLDRITCGWQNTDLIIVAARPSVGKTSLVITMLYKAAKLNYPSLLFSLEMSHIQCSNKILAAETNKSPTDIRNGNINFLEIDSNLNKIYNVPLYIDDTGGINITEIKSKARKLVIEKGIKIIAVDYLQLVTINDKINNRDQEIGIISRGLKALAKELNIPIIALSQLNRMIENRADKRPKLADLRESGNIEQDSDIVIFIDRPEKYGQLQDNDGNSLEGIANLIIAKHRNGAICDISIEVNKYSTKWEDINNLDF